MKSTERPLQLRSKPRSRRCSPSSSRKTDSEAKKRKYNNLSNVTLNEEGINHEDEQNEPFADKNKANNSGNDSRSSMRRSAPRNIIKDVSYHSESNGNRSKQRRQHEHMQLLEKLTIKLSTLESNRTAKRNSLEKLYDQLQEVRSQMNNLQEELQDLDDEIEALEKERNTAAGLNYVTSSLRTGDDLSKDDLGDGFVVDIEYPENLTQALEVNDRFQESNDDKKSPLQQQQHRLTQKNSCTKQQNQNVEEGDSKDEIIEDRESIAVNKPKQSILNTNNTTSNSRNIPLTLNPDEVLPEPPDFDENIEDYYADAPPPFFSGTNTSGEENILESEESYVKDIHVQYGQVEKSKLGMKCTTGINNVMGELEIISTSKQKSKDLPPTSRSSLNSLGRLHRAALPEGLQMTTVNTNCNFSSNASSSKSNGNGTLDHYFPLSKTPSLSSAPSSAAAAIITKSSPDSNYVCVEDENTAPSASSIFPPALQQRYNTNHSFSSNNYTGSTNKRPSQQDRNADYLKQLSSDNFPWSKHVMDQLRNTFKIRNFRDHQKEIINCTMSGDDVFVIMRTGGGKSLTYQLPALLEGRSAARKLTFVVSPLLSLIRDQEDQMNAFSANTAISFTSGMQGGASEAARRWNLVRDRNSGLCIVFVTPEKVHKSNKLRSELEKLHNQCRLGRFVIDECHCACHWGHDFRPDYTKLGILKTHFPDVPLIAVTATASDRVREDCCRILRIGTNYQFFRSSANRPNLVYSVKEKPEGKDKVVKDMADFITKHHAKHAGIVYTFSKKDADDVADKLNDLGISARAYHSSVSESAKESIHRSWMRNRTQVVVATIAFGLGINKPDVRFVLHHSLSKSLEAYYQESGRAGRDGGPADCVLYYSVKDVSRMIGMIHGENGEGAFWSMVRYGQEHGDDALCKRIILSTLGEPGCASVGEVLLNGGSSSTTEVREVGKHAKIVVRLIQCSEKDMTLQQLVAIWRGKNPPRFVEEYPPGADLTRDECERLVAALLLSDVLYPKVVFTAYNSIVYIGLREKADWLLSSPNPKVKVPFPIRKIAPKETEKVKASTQINEKGWIKKKTTPRRKDSAYNGQKVKTRAKQNKGSKKEKKKESTKENVSSQDSEVIDIFDDSEDNDDLLQMIAPISETRPLRSAAVRAAKKMNKGKEIFKEMSSDENEF